MVEGKQLVSDSITPQDSEEAAQRVREKARQLIAQFIDQRGNDKPPFAPYDLARLKNIKQILKSNLGKINGLLLRYPDGYIIKLNEKDGLAKQDFSCAHEIGHLLLNELHLERYIQTIEYRRTFDPQNSRKVRTKTRERLCDIAATELLMPEFVFKKYLDTFGVSVNSIEKLGRIFGVSYQAAAIRMAEVSLKPCVAILWRPSIQNSNRILKLVWQIGPGSTFANNTQYTPVQKTILPVSLLNKAFENELAIECETRFRHRGIIERLAMETKGFGYGDYRYLISLAFPNH